MTFNYHFIAITSKILKADNRTWWEKFKDWLRGYAPPVLYYYKIKIEEVDALFLILLNDMVLLENGLSFVVTAKGEYAELFLAAVIGYPDTTFAANGKAVITNRLFHEGFESNKYD